MILGIGTDLVKINRMERLVSDERRRSRLFTPTELEYARIQRDFLQTCAGLFAAKEALGKALGCGIIGLDPLELEILHEGEGRPVAALHGTALRKMQELGGAKMHLSITHDGEYAQAFAVLEGTGNHPWSEKGAEENPCPDRTN